MWGYFLELYGNKRVLHTRHIGSRDVRLSLVHLAWCRGDGGGAGRWVLVDDGAWGFRTSSVSLQHPHHALRRVYHRSLYSSSHEERDRHQHREGQDLFRLNRRYARHSSEVCWAETGDTSHECLCFRGSCGSGASDPWRTAEIRSDGAAQRAGGQGPAGEMWMPSCSGRFKGPFHTHTHDLVEQGLNCKTLWRSGVL